MIIYPISLRDGHLCVLKKGSCPGLWPRDLIHQSRETHAGPLPGNKGWIGRIFSKLTTAALSRQTSRWRTGQRQGQGQGQRTRTRSQGGAVTDPSVSLKLLILLHSCQSPMEMSSAPHPQMTHSHRR